MWRYLRALGYLFTGRIAKARQALMENEHVMAATYDKSIDRNENRLKTVTTAVAELMTIKNQRIADIKSLAKQEDEFEEITEGAKAMMQKRINQLRADGKSKEEITSDPEFMRHQAAFETNSAKLEDCRTRISDKQADLKNREGQIATYKIELQNMQRAAESLKEEKHEAIADVQIARQQEEINGVLAGIATDTTDSDLAEARAARNRAKSRAEVVTELAGNNARVADSEYKAAAKTGRANSQLDSMLDWGDEDKADLEPAKLPEGA